MKLEMRVGLPEGSSRASNNRLAMSSLKRLHRALGDRRTDSRAADKVWRFRMFQFLFKYPSSIFSKGEFVLLGGWPKWVLLSAGARRRPLASAADPLAPAAGGAPIRNWRAGVIWFLQFALATLVLVLLWQPAITVAELKPQQNIIAVLVDDSRSMAIADQGTSREAQAAKALQNGTACRAAEKISDAPLSPR